MSGCIRQSAQVKKSKERNQQSWCEHHQKNRTYLKGAQIQIFQQGKGGSKSRFPIKFSVKPSMHDTANLKEQHAMQLLLQNHNQN